MIQSPIKRKHLNYPKDFLPNSTRQSTNSKRFTLNQQYHIEASTIKKYEKGFQFDNQELKNSKYTQISINPQKLVMGSMELGQESPLDHHLKQKRPDIDREILKKPRFCIKKDDQIAQNDDDMQISSSPGFIKRQLANRQIPLPLEDPCKIQLLKQYNSKSNKIPHQIIKYKASAFDSDKKWHSNQKMLLQNFKQSRTKKSLNQFPQLKNQSLNKSLNYSGGKELYQNFRKKQQFQADNMGKINSFLSSLKMKDPQSPKKAQFPKFEPSNIERLKQQINELMLSKRKLTNIKSKDNECQNECQENNYEYEQKNHNIIKNKKKANINVNLPEYMVSYRSSLSFLKDLYMQTIDLQQYRLIIKIPKLFTEELIFKNQDKTQLYETAMSIFSELRINHENLIIKRYTNCIMIISRNICMIWHFDGKRYLGGWQTQYLDEGCKHGLGLEWQPKSYVYYGQFVRNKKEGLGVYKDRSENMFIGYWKKGKYINQKQQQTNKYGTNYQQNIQPQNQYLYSEENEFQNNHSNYQYL